MIASIIVITLAYVWLLYETQWLTIRLPHSPLAVLATTIRLTPKALLSGILGLLILAVIGVIVYINVSPPPEDRFTEFFVLGVDGKAEGYPTELVVGEEGWVILGITNHEYQAMSYSVVVQINGIPNEKIGPMTLEHEQEWQQEVSFISRKLGKQELEFLLLKEGEDKPYTSLGPFPLEVKREASP